MICGYPANSFFSTDATWWEKLTYAIITVLLAAVRDVDSLRKVCFHDTSAPPALLLQSVVCAGMAPWLDLPCSIENSDIEYENLDYVKDACILVRYSKLGFMNKRECDHIRRILMSIICGTIIGHVACLRLILHRERVP